MNKLLVLCFASLLSCSTAISQKSSKEQPIGEIIVSQSQGGTEKANFSIIKNQNELRDIIVKNFNNAGIEPIMDIPEFPKNKKLVVYHFGRFNSGDHQLKKINSITVENNILFIDIPAYDSGGMEIQMLSNPWSIIAVPSHLQFNSVQLKYSK